MCGICGFVGQKENREIVIENMLEAIRHRGPDSEGVLQTEEVSFGFCRLSIIDLKTGEQPIFNEDRTKGLIFNGEIYNYRELRKELEERGHIFSTNSDSETLIHAYEEYGQNMLRRLRGMFAFAVWDFEKKELFAARDFFGIKPFFYSMADGCFVFASEIKSILRFPGCIKMVNEQALEQYLSFQYSAMEETFFKDIFRLPPGHFLIYGDHRLKIKKYFDSALSPEDMEEKQLEKRLQKVLKASLSRHLVSDVEIGAFLSGGVDSGYLAAELGEGKTFTVGFRGTDNHYSEIKKAKELASKYMQEHHAKIIEKEEFWEAVPRVMYYLDEPSGDAAAVALYFAAGEAARHVKVVISGEGADEFFGGYNIYKEPKALKWVTWLPRKFRRGVASAAMKFPDIKGRGYLIRAGIPLEERYIGNASIFSTQERRSLLKRTAGAPSAAQFLSSQYQKTSGLRSVSRMQQIDIDNWLPGDILQKADRMSMAHSLELRVPYLDYDIFQVARKLPARAKLHGRQTKYLFRKVAAKRLSGEAVKRKKRGFPVPIRIWIREEPWRSEIEKAFTGKTAEQFFCTDQLLNLLEQHVEGRKDHSRKIWTVYMFLVWHRVYFEEETKEGGKVGNEEACELPGTMI